MKKTLFSGALSVLTLAGLISLGIAGQEGRGKAKPTVKHMAACCMKPQKSAAKKTRVASNGMPMCCVKGNHACCAPGKAHSGGKKMQKSMNHSHKM